MRLTLVTVLTGSTAYALPTDNLLTMTEPVDEDRIADRAQLLPEEITVGSDDPEQQAQAILEDSERRTLEPQLTREESVQTLGE
jgi:hypothetical protein